MPTENIRIHQSGFGMCKKSLRLERVALTSLEENKIRVRIEASNINPSDLLSIHGVGQYRFNHQPPRVPGFEGVGHIVESNNADFLIGQRVVVATSGTWQKYIDVSPDELFHIPEYLENGYATQLYINALTAWILITEVTQLSKEDVVIINAGCSAIGKIFAQLSLSIGYTLLIVTSNVNNYPYGSGYILDKNNDLSTQIQKLNLPMPNIAFDAVGGKSGENLIHTLDHKGRFINYGTLSLEFYENHFFDYVENQNIDFNTFFLGYWENAVGKNARRQRFEMMLDHFITNEIKLDVDRFISLENFQTALGIIESKSTLLEGKIILSLI